MKAFSTLFRLYPLNTCTELKHHASLIYFILIRMPPAAGAGQKQDQKGSRLRRFELEGGVLEEIRLNLLPAICMPTWAR